MPEPVVSLLRIRVVKRHDAGDAEVTSNLPHLHQTHIEVVAMQPGNPGSSAIGSWTCQLFPPGTEQFAAARAIYSSLDYGQRVEFYISHDGQSLGKLYYAGIITGIRMGYGQNPVFELSGVSDIGLLNLSRPFPGELLSTNYGSGLTTNADYRQAHNYFGTNEVGWADSFGSSYSAGNYTSTNIPGSTSGTWSVGVTGSLNDSTGTGAALLAKAGAAPGDKRSIILVEASGVLLPSADGTNAGKMGVGLSASNANCNTSTVVYVTAHSPGAGWNIDVTKTDYSGGAQVATATVTNAMTNVADPDNLIPLTISLNVTSTANSNGMAVVVNGKAIMSNVTSPVIPQSFGTANGSTYYPFLFSGTPATGGASSLFSYLVQESRYTDDQNSGTAAFKAGTIGGTPLASMPNATDPGPTFLEIITRAATREGWYWRYTPQAYVVGTRTLGTIDFVSDPGTDRGTNKSVVFSRDNGNLVDLQLTANADQFVTGTTLVGPPSNDGNGVSLWRDVSTLTKYGALEDQILFVTAPNFSEQRNATTHVSNNRVNLNSAGSKTAIVLRDPQTADVWRELDKVMIHEPELGIFYLVARVIGYTFDEGQATQTLTLDQFSADDPTLSLKRLQQGAFQMGAKFNTR